MRRIMFKISGEAMSGEKEFGFDDKVLNDICEQIKETKSFKKIIDRDYVQSFYDRLFSEVPNV